MAKDHPSCKNAMLAFEVVHMVDIAGDDDAAVYAISP